MTELDTTKSAFGLLMLWVHNSRTSIVINPYKISAISFIYKEYMELPDTVPSPT